MPKRKENTLNHQKYNRIVRGEATDNDKQNFSFANNFFDFLTNLSECTGNLQEFCIQRGNNLASQQIAIFEKDLIPKGYLKNIFVYLSQVIDNIKEININQIKGLLNFCSIFLKTNFSNYTLTTPQKNELAVAYLDLFGRIVKLPNITEVYKKDDTSLKIVDLLNLTNNFIPAWVKLNNNTDYPIFENLIYYFENIGNLADRSKDKNHNISTILTPTMKLIQVLEPYLDSNQKNELILYSFSDQCNSADTLKIYNDVFDTTNSDPCNVNKNYEQIKKGYQGYHRQISLINHLKIGKLILEKINSEKTIPLTDKESVNILNYFKQLIKKTNGEKQVLSHDFINVLCQFLSNQFGILKNNDHLLMYYRSSFSLFLALLKNPSAINNPLIYQTLKTAFIPMEILLTSILQNPSKDKTLGILSTFEIFADMLHLAANDIPTVALEEKKEIADEIEKLFNICFEIEACHSSSALDQSFETLGSMVRNLSKKNQTQAAKDNAQAIQNITKLLIENAKNKSVLDKRINNFAYAFLDGRHDNNTKAIEKNCKEIFNRTNCQKFIPANQTVELDINIIIPKSTTVIPAANIPRIPAINQTSSSTSFSNTTTEFPVNLSNTTSNQTAIDPANTQNVKPLSLGSTLALGASAAHGVGSGMINGIIQYFATKYSRHGRQSSKAKAVAIYSSLLAHAAFAATFPLMLFKIQEQLNQGNEDEAQQLWDNLLLQALPTFISSASFSLCLHAGYEFTRLCFNRFHAVAQNTVPFLGTAYNLYHKPLETSVQLSASIATSSLTYFGLNQLSPIKNRQSSDIETSNKCYVEYNANAKECAFELQPLNEEEETNLSHTINGIQKDSTPAEIFFDKVQFTTSKQFANLQHYLAQIIEKVESLKDKLIDQDQSNRLGKILDIPEYNVGLRHDLKDLENFPEKFGAEYNKCIDEEQKSAALRRNLDYFKTMIKTIYDKLLSDNVNDDCLKDILCSIETKTLKEDIIKSIKFIKENLGFIRTITKPIISIHLSKETIESDQKNGTAMLVRKHSKGVNHVNNRYTYHANSDSDTRFSSGSEKGSILSTGSSKDGEDIQINRCLL